ncbi:MAG: FAD-binding protein [Phototrophicaceae bacterium]
MTHKNWAGNYTYSTAKLHYPTSIEEIQDLVQSSTTIKVLGSRHSFNHISDSSDTLISLTKLPEFINIDPENMTVTVSAGMNYGQVATYLQKQGFALHNLASLPHISIVGACATGTHGSGVNNGNLATAVSGIEFISGTGLLISMSRDDGGIFKGLIVNLGAIGIITQITLDIVPTYEVRQDVYLNLDLAQLDTHFDDIMASAYSVSLFTHYQNESINQVWLKSRVEDNPDFIAKDKFYGAISADRNYHPIADVSAENCTEQLGFSGAWHDRLPHFRMDFMPSKGDELQSEYFIPRKYAIEAIRCLYDIGDIIASKLLVGEIRCVASDNLWLSECYQEDSVAFHFTWEQDRDAVNDILIQMETALVPFNPRPHWGKIFTMSAKDVQSHYEKLADFRMLIETLNPQGKFRNEFVNQYIF